MSDELVEKVVPVDSPKKSKETKEKETIYELPKSNVQRIVKSVLPEGFSVVSDAKNGFSKASMVFIMYLTAKAAEISKKQKKSTMSGEDVIAAIEELGFDGYKDALQDYLEELKETKASKKTKKTKEQVKEDEEDEEEIDDDKEEEQPIEESKEEEETQLDQ